MADQQNVQNETHGESAQDAGAIEKMLEQQAKDADGTETVDAAALDKWESKADAA